MNIDNVIKSVGMGRYQLMSCAIFGVMILYTNVTSVMYIFTAGDLKYRCEIPECDVPDPAQRTYEPNWLRFTTPYREDTGRPQKCMRNAVNASVRINPVNGSASCVADAFDGNATETCGGNWVFEEYENTIATEFELMCEENKWKLSAVGSIHNLGQFIGIPVSGIISDKFGRKFTMVFGAVAAAVVYIVQSFSTSYLMFLTLEIICSTVFSGVYSATFILAMESVLPNKRVIYYTILECFNPMGGMVVALIASQVQDWRLLLRMSNTPALLFLSYFWLTDESMRWLEMRGKHDKVITVLKRIATINKKPFVDLPPDASTETRSKDETEVKANVSILKDVLHSSTILWRMTRCSFTWVAATLVYYGLNISSTDIAGNKYLNFSLVLFVELPACLLSWFVMEKMSRKMALSYMFVFSGTACVLYNLTPNRLGYAMKLSLFLISKLSISAAFSIVYIQTAEIFPTTMRVTMLSLCSMIGRIGSMMAPQITLLSEYFGEYVAMLFMGSTALVAAVVTMTLPESKNVKLPDTIGEAEQIGNDVPLITNNVQNIPMLTS